MHLPMRGHGKMGYVAVAFLVVSVTLGGCLSVDEGPTHEVEKGESGEEGLYFSWSPTPADGVTGIGVLETQEFVVALNITAGPDTECIFIREYGGRTNSEHGIVHLGVSFDGLRVSTIYNDWATLHVGPANSGRITGSQEIGGWGSFSRYSAENGTSIEVALAAFGYIHDEDNEPAIEVTCDTQSARIAFYEASDYSIIHDGHATGGMGFSLSTNYAPWYSYTENGEFAINTDSELVLFHAHTSPRSGGEQEGDLTLRDPEGVTSYSLDPPDTEDGKFLAQKKWQQGGEYSLVVNRIATDYWPLAGILAGFDLKEEKIGEGFNESWLD